MPVTGDVPVVIAPRIRRRPGGAPGDRGPRTAVTS